MKIINGLLEHYRQLFKDNQLSIDLIIDIIKKETGIKLFPIDLKLKEGILFIKTKPKHKLEVLLKKTKILEQFKDKDLKILDLK